MAIGTHVCKIAARFWAVNPKQLISSMQFFIRLCRPTCGARRWVLPVVVCGAVAFLATGCSPRFNWRDYQGNGGFAATFPDKVQTATRSIELAGVELNMTLSAARVDKISFAVGSARLPNSDPQLRDRALAELRMALIHNIEGKVQSEREASVARLSRGDPQVSADAIEVSGQAQGNPVRMWAEIAYDDQSVYEMFVLGPVAAMQEVQTREAVDTFMSSFRLQ